MATINQQAEKSTDLECGDLLDITLAEGLRLKLLDALDKSKTINLHASEVERTDTAALQVLCSFFKDANSKGITARWHNPTNSVLEAAELLGLTDILELSVGS